MKFLFILLLSFQASAIASAQNITIQVNNKPLWEVLTKISNQSGMPLIYTGEIDITTNSKPVSLNLINVPLKNALDAIFNEQPYSYRINQNSIIITKVAAEPKSKKELGELPLIKPKDKIKGKVKNTKGEPLPGVTIRVRGTNMGTTSDADGNFSLDCGPSAYLLFSYVGFQRYELAVAGKQDIQVILEELAGQLEETVVKGYYLTTKLTNTGNVSTVKAEALARQPISDPVVALQGQVAGLSISQSSGVPGAGITVRLRGQNSIANGNNPLYIVDGVPFTSQSLYTGLALGSSTLNNASPFSSLRLTDIESIDVLKDADATAIYGSRGANGVILITTKKGKEGKTRFNVNVYTGGGQVGHQLHLMNTPEYLAMRRQAFKNDGKSPGATDYDLNGQWDSTRFTDWQKTLIGGTAKVRDAQASLSGGTARTQFVFGGGYCKETTPFPGDYSDVKASAHVNINHQSENGRFRSNFTASYVNDVNQMPLMDFTSSIFLAPNAPPIYNPDGSFNWANSSWYNPLWPMQQRNTSTTDHLNTALNFDYDLFKGLKFTTRIGYNDLRLESINILPLEDNPDYVQDPNQRKNVFGNNRVKSWIIEPSVSYTFTLWKGKVESLIGTTFQQTDTRGLSQSATGFTSNDVIPNLSAATNIFIASTVQSRYRYNALYARIGYNIDDKYLLNFTGRRDGSSRFGPGKRFGTFGAVGGAWVLSKESFMQSTNSILSFAKLRASYGLTGNDQLGDYNYLSTYSNNQGTYQGGTGLLPTQLTNPDYSWETVKKMEAGLELGFFQDRVLFNTSVYRHRTGNQLVGYNLPSITGFTTVTANLPAVIQNTGIEFEITSRNIQREGFSWSTSANFSIPRNKLISFPDLAASPYANSYTIGQPLSQKFLYTYLGINPTTGLYTVADVNGDGKITLSGDRKGFYFGEKFFGGITNSLNYKGFQLDVFVQFVKQNGYENASTTPGSFPASGSNQFSDVLEKLTDKSLQPYTAGFGTPAAKAYSLFNGSNGRLVDASYIRVKNISLSWTLPEQLQKPLKLTNARIYLQAQNLFTLTGYKGLDPETSSKAISINKLPVLKMITAGLSVSF